MNIFFRSYYYPVKNILDGDLCEQFNTLEPAKQKSIAEELDRTPAGTVFKYYSLLPLFVAVKSQGPVFITCGLWACCVNFGWCVQGLNFEDPPKIEKLWWS